MGIIKKRPALWQIVLIAGVAAIALPAASRFNVAAKAVDSERQELLVRQTAGDNGDAVAKAGKDKSHAGYGKVRDAVDPPGKARQDDYERRRQDYWERRVEKRLENLDEESGDDDDDAKDTKDSKDSKDTKDKKDSKADKDKADDDDVVDKEVERDRDFYERRREYYRDRLDKEW